MYKNLLAISHKMEAFPVLDSIKRGFLICLPLLMTGIVSLIFISIPITAIQNWYASSTVGDLVYSLFHSIYDVTYSFMALYLGVAIAFTYGRYFARKNTLLLAASVVASLISILFSLGYQHEGFDVSSFNATGVFTAFITTALCTKLFYVIYDFIDVRRDKSRFSNIENRIHSIYLMMIPFSICIILFFFFNEILYRYNGMYSLNDVFSRLMSMIFVRMGVSLWSGMLLTFFESIMWFLGIHGGSVMEAVCDQLFIPADTNASLIMSKTFLDTFALIGGCGTSICLFIAMIFWEKRREQKTVLRTAALPILFNVSEPLIYGVPIIFNPFLLIPLLITPQVAILIAYGATVIGFIPPINHTIEWTTPIFLSGYAATGSIHGAVVQFVIILCGVLIYMPFVKVMNKQDSETIGLAAEALEDQYRQHMEDSQILEILKGHNSWAIAGESIVSSLKEDINNRNIQLYYQPQIDAKGKIYGAEALLRWTCANRQMFPPFVIHMATEAGLQDRLGLAIVRQVCEDITVMKKDPRFNLRISVNISCLQLNNEDFMNQVIATAQEYGVSDYLCIEVTEELSVEKLMNAPDNISKLNKANIEVSMDDFSMGSTSIKSLRENNFSHVKLDGSLVSDMENNQRSKEIIASIIALGDSLNFDVVAEYVDSPSKLEELKRLGVDYFQGYYYSPAIPLNDFMDYIRKPMQ